MREVITGALIAPCGINCGICRGHLRAHNPCTGCNAVGQCRPKTREQCVLKLCTKRTGRFCCDCAGFPCVELRKLDKRYRTKYGMSEIENLRYIKAHGIRKFVARERRRWVSRKGVLCVHDRKYYPV